MSRIELPIRMVKVDKYFITRKILSKISDILSHYRIHAKIIKRSEGWGERKETKQKRHLNPPLLLHHNPLQPKHVCYKGKVAASRSFDTIKASEMCQTLSFLPDGGVCCFHIWLLMDKQASLPVKQWSKLRKQTNKSNHALDMEANDRYDWSGVQLEAVITQLRETGRAWHVSRARDYHGVLGR